MKAYASLVISHVTKVGRTGVRVRDEWGLCGGVSLRLCGTGFDTLTFGVEGLGWRVEGSRKKGSGSRIASPNSKA